MAKSLFRFTIGACIWTLFLAACAPAKYLPGTGGEGETAPTQEESPGGGNGTDNEGTANETNLETRTYNFYLPTLTVTTDEGGENYETSLSSPPMGKADFQLTAPKILRVNEERDIELVIIPNTIELEKK